MMIELIIIGMLILIVLGDQILEFLTILFYFWYIVSIQLKKIVFK